MTSDCELGDVVLFDVSFEADGLCDRLRDRSPWVHFRAGHQYVAVAFGPDPADLGRLLRTVEAWIAESAVSCVGMELDGRSYELRARRPLVARV
jgi:hypothetical protein